MVHGREKTYRELVGAGRVFLLALGCLGACLLTAALGAQSARAAGLDAQQLKEDAYSAVAVGELTAPAAHPEGTLGLLETELIVKVNAQESLGEGEAGELKALLEGVKPAMPGETATAAIEDLNGLVSDLQLGQQTQPSPLRYALRVAAKELGREILLEVEHGDPTAVVEGEGLEEPYAPDRLWWGNSANAVTNPYNAVRQAYALSQTNNGMGLLLEHVTGVNPYASIKTIVEKAGTVADKLNTVIGLFGSKDVSATEAESEEAGDRQGVKQEAGNSLVTWKTLDEQNESAGLKAFKADGEDISGDTEEEAFTTLAAESEGSIKETVADTSLAADEVTEEVASIGIDAGEDAAEVGLGVLDPALALQALSNAPAMMNQILSLFGAGEPSSEQIVLEQLHQIEKMVEEVGNQVQGLEVNVNYHFDEVGVQIKDMAEAVQTSVLVGSEAGEGIGAVDHKLSALTADVFEVGAILDAEPFKEAEERYLRPLERHHAALDQEKFENAEAAFNRRVGQAGEGIAEPKTPVAPPGEEPEALNSALRTLAGTAHEWTNEPFWTSAFNPQVWAEGTDALTTLMLENPTDYEKLGGSGNLATRRREATEFVREVKRYASQNLINEARKRYGEDALQLTRALESETGTALSEKDGGGVDANCKPCALGKAAAVGSEGQAYINPWSGADQTPSGELAPAVIESYGNQATEGSPELARINQCASGSAHPLEVSKTLSYAGRTNAPNPLFNVAETFGNVLANAWHLGLGDVRACYETNEQLAFTGSGQRTEWHYYQFVLQFQWEGKSLGRLFFESPATWKSGCAKEATGEASFRALWSQQTAEAAGCAPREVYLEQLMADLITGNEIHGFKEGAPTGNCPIPGETGCAGFSGGSSVHEELAKGEREETEIVNGALEDLRPEVDKRINANLKNATSAVGQAMAAVHEGFVLLSDYLDLAVPKEMSTDSLQRTNLESVIGTDAPVRAAIEAGIKDPATSHEPAAVTSQSLLVGLFGFGSVIAEAGTEEEAALNQLVPATDERVGLTEFVLEPDGTPVVGPKITIASPTEGGTYVENKGPGIEFECEAATGEAIQECVAEYEEEPGVWTVVEPNKVEGAPINLGPGETGYPIYRSTGTAMSLPSVASGLKFRVKSEDSDRNKSETEFEFSVSAAPPPPNVSIDSPSAGDEFEATEPHPPTMEFSCSSQGTLKPGLEGCFVVYFQTSDDITDEFIKKYITAATGQASGTTLHGVVAGNVGEWTAYVVSRDTLGQETIKAVNYTIYAAPSGAITSPANWGEEFYAGEGPVVDYSCNSGPHGFRTPCEATLEGEGTAGFIVEAVHSGEALPESLEGLGTEGEEVFQVVLGASGPREAQFFDAQQFEVLAPKPPNVAITAPAEGTTYTVGQEVPAAFECTEALATAHLLDGPRGCEGSVPDGQLVDTSTPGTHEFTATGRGRDGLSEVKTIKYYVGSPTPSVSGLAPARGTSAGGTPVTITGAGFDNVTAVKFGSQEAVHYEVVSETEIVALAPAQPTGEVEVTVTGEGGTSGASSGDHFTYYTPRGPAEHLPELGRCEKLAQPTGVFANAGCTERTATESDGAYEWIPGPGPQPTFLFRNRGAVLKTHARARIKCSENTYAGEYTGANTITVNLTLTGCEPVSHLGIKCQSIGAGAGEINFSALEGHLGFIKQGTVPSVGLALSRLREAPWPGSSAGKCQLKSPVP